MDDTTVESPFEKVWLTENPLEINTDNMDLRIQCSRIVYSRHEALYNHYHSHDFFELHYVIEGQLDVEFENIGVISVKRGNLIVCKPNLVHRTVYASPNTQKFVFGFYCDTKKDLLTKAREAILRSPIKVIEDTDRMQMFLVTMLSCVRYFNSVTNEILKNQLESFVLEVLNIYINDGNYRESSVVVKEEHIVEAAKEFIVLNANRSISVEDVAKELGFSVRHLNRIAKLSVGCTLSEMIISARISYAKELLKNTTLTVSEIAERGNFVDISTFTKFFKRYAGVPPTEYRKTEQ